MKKTWSLVLGVLLASASMAAESRQESGGAILVYCAAGIKEPVAEIAALFEKETGTKVQLTYANSGQLLG
jgi:molybdate transport system substrate-binding protein